MSDIVMFKAMLKRAKISWQDGPYDEDDELTGEKGDTVLYVQPDNKGVTGYVMFRTEFAFKPDGSLRAIGCWE